ncbi:CPBP family intramembrane glutamic endopeptidase [Haloferula sargassicola]|uniref:CAAX prenyl protease 2/Lysostaphin resistance protein A-like domain-containing protein n=1 Tax=Haloferula sargassicola TaxID=490096 RepID=A0ABP9UTG1_9BACT
MALRKADRDLRLAEGLREMPSWLRALFGVDSVDRTLRHAIANLEQLVSPAGHHHEHPGHWAGDQEGAYALAVLVAVREHASPAAGPFRQYGLDAPPTENEIATRIIEGRETWWDLAYFSAFERKDTEAFVHLAETRTGRLVGNTLKARGTVIALTLGGLFFVPGTLLAFMRARSRGPRVNYTERWNPTYGLGVFLLAYLAYLGFATVFEQLAGHVARSGGDGPLFPMPVFIALDSLTRFLPALIALGLLFRKARHVRTRFGLGGPFDGKLVLGAFAMLQILDFGLRVAFDRFSTGDPTGGLSSAEEGPWGLVLGIVSACMAAPIAEEILYRGVLFRSLANRLPVGVAALLSAVVFALVHFVPGTTLLLIGVVGFMTAMTYAASRTLLTAIVLHALYNAAVKIPEWIIYQTPLF